MKSLLTIFMFFIFVLTPIFSLEEQSYQVRVQIDESRKEKLIFPLPDISYENEKKTLTSENKEYFVLSFFSDQIIDLCGLIPIKEDS